MLWTSEGRTIFSSMGLVQCAGHTAYSILHHRVSDAHLPTVVICSERLKKGQSFSSMDKMGLVQCACHTAYITSQNFRCYWGNMLWTSEGRTIFFFNGLSSMCMSHCIQYITSQSFRCTPSYCGDMFWTSEGRTIFGQNGLSSMCMSVINIHTCWGSLCTIVYMLYTHLQMQGVCRQGRRWGHGWLPCGQWISWHSVRWRHPIVELSCHMIQWPRSSHWDGISQPGQNRHPYTANSTNTRMCNLYM